MSSVLKLAVAVTIAGWLAPTYTRDCFRCVILKIDDQKLEKPSVTVQNPISLPSSFMGLFSPETTPVEILCYGTYFRIPRNFLESVLVSSDHTSVAFAVDVKFPKFLGVTANPQDKDAIYAGGKVFLPGNDPSMIRMVASQMSYSPEHDPNEIVFNAEKGVPDVEGQFGLLISKSRTSVINSVYFKRSSGSFKGFVAICNNDYKYCNSFLRISNQVVIEYQYSAVRLKDWRDVSHGVERLINSWVVN